MSSPCRRGAGGKAFCAGGDIRAITEVPGGEMQRDFFREEYRLDHLVSTVQYSTVQYSTVHYSTV